MICSSRGYSTKYQYKKDDDYGIKEAQTWTQTYSSFPNIHLWEIEEIKNYALRLLKDLTETVPIVPANLGMVKEHLVQLANLSERLQKILIERLGHSTIEESLRKELVVKLIFTCPKNA